MRDKSIAANSYLVVDAGGPGRAFCDLLNTRNVTHTRMQIVGGENETETQERGITFNNVSKNLLLGTLNSSLESFEASIGTSGRMKIEGGTKDAHADIAMAAAMALWLSDHRTVGAMVGEQQLRGYW